MANEPAKPKKRRKRATKEATSTSLLSRWEGKERNKTITMAFHSDRLVHKEFKGLCDAIIQDASRCMVVASHLMNYVVTYSEKTPPIGVRSNGQTFVNQCISSVLSSGTKDRSLVTARLQQEFMEATKFDNVDFPLLRRGNNDLLFPMRNTLATAMMKHVRDHFKSFPRKYLRHLVRKRMTLPPATEEANQIKEASKRAFAIATKIWDAVVTLPHGATEEDVKKHGFKDFEEVALHLFRLFGPLREGGLVIGEAPMKNLRCQRPCCSVCVVTVCTWPWTS